MFNNELRYALKDDKHSSLNKGFYMGQLFLWQTCDNRIIHGMSRINASRRKRLVASASACIIDGARQMFVARGMLSMAGTWFMHDNMLGGTGLV